MKPLTTDILIKCGVSPKHAPNYVDSLNRNLPLNQIVTFLRLSHFLSQVIHESIGLSVTVENLNYSAMALVTTWPKRFPTIAFAEQYQRNPEKIANYVYANRLGNGDEKSGNGWKYRGRGNMQCTGKDKYVALSLVYGIDYVLHPEWLERPADAILSAFWYWDMNNINRLADKDDILAVTKAINGGLIGIEDRKRLLIKCKAALAQLFI